MNLEIALLLIGAYILGAIPFGVLIAKTRAGIDITKLGSGNIGATNVHRVLGWKYSVPVMILDIGKGAIPPLIAKTLHLTWGDKLGVVDVSLLAGFAAVLGHCASPFLKFKGGKGVATICGAALGATPLIAAAGVIAFVLVTWITRYISVASIVSVVVAIAAALLLMPRDAFVIGAFILIGVFIVYKHRANIKRLMKGEEPKFIFKGGKKAPETQEASDKPNAPEQEGAEKELDKEKIV